MKYQILRSKISYLMRLLFLLIFSITSFAYEINKLPVYNEQNRNIVVITKNSTFVIHLKSNPTTGYSWALQYDKQFIELIRHSFQPASNKQLIGAPGFEQWTFKTKPAAFATSQKTVIHFSYARPWEKIKPAVTLDFTVLLPRR